MLTVLGAGAVHSWVYRGCASMVQGLCSQPLPGALVPGVSSGRSARAGMQGWDQPPASLPLAACTWPWEHCAGAKPSSEAAEIHSTKSSWIQKLLRVFRAPEHSQEPPSPQSLCRGTRGHRAMLPCPVQAHLLHPPITSSLHGCKRPWEAAAPP